MTQKAQEIIPVYVVTGFLESGKTSIINTMVEDDGFSRGMKTLLIVCEEGEEEYDEEMLLEKNTKMVTLDDKEQLTLSKLNELNRSFRPQRVIMEYNNMWTLEPLAKLDMPPRWEYVQVITMADATTYDNYMTNMRQLMTDPMKEADLIMINRCKPEHPKSSWRRQIRAFNRNCNIIFENTDGSTEDGVSDEDLPYNMKAEVIDIPEEHIGTFYMDSLDHPERYDGKKIRMTGQVYPDDTLPQGYFFFGRIAMTCCANDIQEIGWLCQGNEQPTGPKNFVKLTARCEKVPYGDSFTTIFHEIKAEKGLPPKQKYVTFT